MQLRSVVITLWTVNPLGPIVFPGPGTEFWMVISPQDVVMVKRYDACGVIFDVD